MRIRLNEKWLDRRAAPPPGQMEEYRDAQTPGLYVRHIGPPAQEGDTPAERRARSTMTFMWRRSKNGIRYSQKLGRREPGFALEDAVTAANEWNVRVAKGTAEEEGARRGKIPTVAQLYEAFKVERKPRRTYYLNSNVTGRSR